MFTAISRSQAIWFHFFYNKFRVMEAKVGPKANRYWWKRLIPPLEFGSMHAILFQMALLPLTMCRHTLSELSTTALSRVVPFNRTTAMHIHLGYTMISIVFLATIVFFVFFGTMCSDQRSGIEPAPKGVNTFCMKFEAEIFLTGLAILFLLLLVGFTSFFRNKIPYEVFYGIHHCVFLMFALTIAHTMDAPERAGLKVRSQTFKWYSAPLLYYFVDRAFMYINHHYVLPAVSCTALDVSLDGTGSKMVILKLKKPVSISPNAFIDDQDSQHKCSSE